MTHAHPAHVGASLSADSALLARVSNDGAVSVIDTASDDIAASFSLPPSRSATPVPCGITTTSFTPDDGYLFTAPPGGELIRCDIGESDLIALACYRADSSLTPGSWEQCVQSTPPADLVWDGSWSGRPADFYLTAAAG